MNRRGAGAAAFYRAVWPQGCTGCRQGFPCAGSTARRSAAAANCRGDNHGSGGWAAARARAREPPRASGFVQPEHNRGTRVEGGAGWAWGCGGTRPSGLPACLAAPAGWHPGEQGLRLDGAAPRCAIAPAGGNRGFPPLPICSTSVCSATRPCPGPRGGVGSPLRWPATVAVSRIFRLHPRAVVASHPSPSGRTQPKGSRKATPFLSSLQHKPAVVVWV